MSVLAGAEAANLPVGSIASLDCLELDLWLAELLNSHSYSLSEEKVCALEESLDSFAQEAVPALQKEGLSLRSDGLGLKPVSQCLVFLTLQRH